MNDQSKLHYSDSASSATVSLEDGYEFVIKPGEAQHIVQAQIEKPDEVIQVDLNNGGQLYFKPSRVVALKLG